MAIGEKRRLKIIGAADGGGAVAKVLACHVVEAAFKRPVLTQVLVCSHFGIEISMPKWEHTRTWVSTGRLKAASTTWQASTLATAPPPSAAPIIFNLLFSPIANGFIYEKQRGY